MTSERQRAANRTNARKSTGPKTTAGKSRAAGNARRHGLTAAPDMASLARWYRIILDDSTALPDAFERDPYRRAARILAEAEAQLERVRQAEDAWFRDPEGQPSAVEDFSEERQMIEDTLEEIALQRELLPQSRMTLTAREAARSARGAARLLERFDEHELRMRIKRLRNQEQLGRTLCRYRAAAEARRRKALRRWADEIAKRSQAQSEGGPSQSVDFEGFCSTEALFPEDKGKSH